MDNESKKELIDIVKQSVAAAVRCECLTSPAAKTQILTEHRGCFVTLKTAGELRGCIGTFVSDKPLIETAAQMAVAAVKDDYRFADNPIMPDELASLDIEVSVLSPLKLTADPLTLELGTHGIYITKGYQSGCFLPQVANETGWSKEQFLSYCCSHKAGLSPDAWKQKDTKVYLFTAEIINATP